MLVCLRIYFSFLYCFHLYKQRLYHHLAIGDGNLKILYTGKQGGFGVVEDCDWQGWIHWQGLLLPPSLGMWTCLNFLSCAYSLRYLDPLASKKWCYVCRQLCNCICSRWSAASLVRGGHFVASIGQWDPCFFCRGVGWCWVTHTFNDWFTC